MGAWDAGRFQNDTAFDWVGDLCESGDAETVRTALSRTGEKWSPPQPSFIGRLLLGRRRIEPCLKASVATQALAAAEIVAFWLGRPTAPFPEKLKAWAQQHAGSFTPEFVTLALQAITTIKTQSELKDLW